MIAFGPASPDSGFMNSESVPSPVVDELTPVRSSAQRLRTTLRLNALTSTFGGLVCLLAGGWTSTLLGTGHAGFVRLVGLGLVVFAFDVAAVAGARVSRLVGWAPVVSIADAVWVAATVLTIAAGWYSTGGGIVVGLVGAMVATFGVTQLCAWQRHRSTVGSRLVSGAP